MIENHRYLFNIPETVHYLNCAYMSPLLNSAAQARCQAVAAKSQSWLIALADFISGTPIVFSLFAALINTQVLGEIISDEQCRRESIA